MLHSTYPAVMCEQHVAALKALDMNTIVYGVPNSGKRTVILQAFPKATPCDIADITPESMSRVAQGAVFTGRKTIVVEGNLKPLHCKRLCGIFDTYSTIHFVIPVLRPYTLPDEIRSRCALYHVAPPPQQLARDFLVRVTDLDGQVIERIVAEHRTPHDILLAADMAAHGCGTDISHWHCIADDLVRNLGDATFPHIRRQLLKLITLFARPSDIYRRALRGLASNPALGRHMGLIAELAALYEHRSVIGNKPLYHLEAFFFAVKDLL